MRALRLTPERLVAVGVLVLIALVFLNVSSKNPPGFFRDESAIAYNAYTLSRSGEDEYGARVPLFIKSFGDYKSPLYVYLLAGVFRVTGPSIAVARTFSAVLGLAAILVLFALAFKISRSLLIALAVASLAGLSPWLFEISRLVFEVALEPVLLALFLLTLYQAATVGWRRRHSVGLGLLLGAIVYTYQVGRILAPCFAVGLVLFFRDGRRRQIVETCIIFLATLAPLAVYARVHPGALQARYTAVTYQDTTPWWDIGPQFVVHYVRNLNLWGWLVHGDSESRHHVQGVGSLFWVEVGLAVAGTVIVLLHRRHDPWWRFVLFGVLVTPIAASLTKGSLHTLRMILLPILLPLLAIPAMQAIGGISRRPLRGATIVILAAVFVVETIHFRVVFARDGPERSDVFEAQIQPVIEAAFRHGGKIYVAREIHAAYIDSLWYGALAGRSRSSTVILDWGDTQPPGALLVGWAWDCPECETIAVDGDFKAYLRPP
jgi:4-amino-4-deoxy-L-arabinose transferase-like glycosyltransferase